MNRDELYPVIDEVLHMRLRPYEYAGSYWIDDYAELRIHELAEALCDAIVGRLARGPLFSMPEMEAIKSFLLRYAETQSAATVGNWNDSPRDVLKAVLGDEGQSVIDWVLGGPS